MNKTFYNCYALCSVADAFPRDSYPKEDEEKL